MIQKQQKNEIIVFFGLVFVRSANDINVGQTCSIYSAAGYPYALKYTGTLYYYITNLQGDVLHIVNTSGTPVVSYTYDPYGKPLTTTGTEATTLGAHNPLRYRGYVYDTETGLYYLQSRYYDPEIGRFINGDAFASTGQGIIGCNMFAYCGNNPVVFFDPFGTRKDVCVRKMDESGSGFIYNQHYEPYSSMEMGLTTLSHGGCGPIAVYNALKIMGRSDISLQYVINYFEENNGLLLGGFLGSSPYACIDFFEAHGYTVLATKNTMMYDEIAATADACILWCWFDTSSFPGLGAHFIAFEQKGERGIYYNAYGNSSGPYKYTGGCHEFLGWYDASYPVLIMIYDTAE